MISSFPIGCATEEAIVSEKYQSRRIVDILIDETSDFLNLIILGNRNLIHTEEKQEGSDEIALYFPDTALEGLMGRFVPPDNPIVGAITATESIEVDRINVTINIALKQNTTYRVFTTTNGLQLTFPKTSPISTSLKPEERGVDIDRESAQKKKSIPTATALKSVKTQAKDKVMTVDLISDGRVTKYKSFTLKNPARIVFDLYRIRTQHTREQKIRIQSKQVDQIRYFGHPDKLRLVIETHSEYLSNYSSAPTETGLRIQISSNN